MADPKTGPITRAELEAVWKSVTDPEYSRAFLEKGEGQGYEAHTQAMEQLVRVSDGIDQTTQSLYVKPWSGQTNEPASGGRPSSIDLTFIRSSVFVRDVVLNAGTQVEEVATDFGANGGELVTTGRRYLLTQTIGFTPGEPGPIAIAAIADRFGEGHDNPLPNTLTSIVQLGAGLTNTGANLVPGVVSHDLVLAPNPDVITHAQIGQYVEFTAGANLGQMRQIIGIIPPEPNEAIPTGGIVQLAATQVFRFASVTGTFIQGETIEQASTGASSTVVLQGPTHLVAQRLSGDIVAGSAVVGVQIGATAIFNSVDQAADLLPETGTAGWRVLSWAELGISVTNETSPLGGRAATLDEIGAEREIFRGENESDATYRERVANFADFVSPKAILRIANRILVPYGYEARLREVGYPDFRGFFYDGDSTVQDPAIAFAYDLNFTVRPKQRFLLGLDYTEFRAFFLLEVPRLGLGEFGFAYDIGAANAYDAAPYLVFMDGYPATAAQIYKSLWNAIYGGKAGGVGFDFVQRVDENYIPPPAS